MKIEKWGVLLKVTPYKDLDDYEDPDSIESKIDIFEKSTIGWQLEIADLLINGGIDCEKNEVKEIKGSGFAVLQILVSYFEMIAKYKEGFERNGDSTSFFKKGVISVFPELKEYNNTDVNDLLEVFWRDGRNGLYHGGMTESRILISHKFPILGFEPKNKILMINPHKLPQKLIEHFRKYINELKDPNEIESRDNFEKRFNWHRRNK